MASPVVETTAISNQTSNATSKSDVTSPSGVLADDIVLIFIAMDGDAANPEANADGFASLTSFSEGTVEIYVLWKRSTGSEPANYTVNWTGSEQARFMTVRVSGCITTGDPWDIISSGVSNTNSIDNVINRLTSTVIDTLALYACVVDRSKVDSGDTITGTGWSQVGISGSSGGVNGAGLIVGENDMPSIEQVEAGTFGTWGSDGNASRGFNLKPPVAGVIVKVEPEQLDLVEGAVAVVTGVQIADEILSLQSKHLLSHAGILTRIDFEDRVTDQVGANNGTWTGTEQYEQGPIGKAGKFDDSSRVNLANEANFDREINQPFSLSVWIKINNDATHHMMVTKGDSVDVNQGYYLWDRTSIDKFEFQLRTSTPQTNLVQSTTIPIVGRWYHVVATYDGNSNRNGMKIYVNGNLENVGTASVITGSILNALTLALGAENDGGLALDGSLDDFQFYNRELTGEEVRQMWNESVAVSTRVRVKDEILSLQHNHLVTHSGIVTHIDFDDVVTDKVGPNNGTWTGTETYVQGQVGKAGQFDASSRVELLNEANFDREINQPFSIALWMKIDSAKTGIQTAISKGPAINANGYYVLVSADPANDLLFRIVSNSVIHAVQNSNFTKDVWHHVVVTFSGNSNRNGMTLYTDGVAIKGTVQAMTTSALNADVFTIGSEGGGTRTADAEIDDVQFYNRELNAEEVRQMLNEAIVHRGRVFEKGEILDLPEGSLAHRARVFLKSEILDLAEDVLTVLGIVKVDDEILDLSEDRNFVRGQSKINPEILDLAEGSVITRALIRLKDEILDLAEAVNPLRAFSKVNPETLDLPEEAINVLGIVKLKDEILRLAEGAVNVLGIVKLKNEILDLAEQANGLLTKVMETLFLVEGAISKTVINIIANETLDIPEQRNFTKALIRLKSEALELVEGSVITKALIRLKAEILDLVEGSVAHRGRVFVTDEILDLPETEFAILGIVRVSDETLDLVEDSLSVLGLVKIGDEILDLPEARNFIRGRIKVNPEVLDIPEDTIFTRTLVRLDAETLDLPEATIRIIGFPKIVAEVLDLVEGTVFTRALVRLKDEILELVEGSVIAKGIIRLKAEVLDLVESALALVPLAGLIVKIANEILDLAESAIAKFRAVDFRKAIPGITFTRGTDATGTPRGTDAIVLNRGTNARLIAENQ